MRIPGIPVPPYAARQGDARLVGAKLTTAETYLAYVREHCGDPDGGTPSSYTKAIEKLCTVFTADKPIWAPVVDVWQMTDPKEIMALYEKIKEAQDQFIKYQSGIFLPYKGHGDSYYRKRWCSAALKFFAQFRASEDYESKFFAALNSSTDGVAVAAKAEKINLGDLPGYLPDDIDVTTKEGKEIARAAKQRVGQDQFRKWILNIYGGKCCVTGLDVPEVLRASHIVAWADDAKNRLNPSNGLCLSATYDAAFDKHLITFDDQYRMVLSKSLHDHCTTKVLKDYFLAFEGKAVVMPSRFLPDQKLLAKHREKLVA